MSNKSFCIAYLGNALNDTRITNLSNSLKHDGCKVNVISFDWTTSNFKEITGDTKVFKLDKSKSSVKFYLTFLKILNKQLSQYNAKVFIAEDVYTLPLVTFWAKRKGAKIYYNCRELYPFLAGLRHKAVVQNMIKIIERFFIRKADLILTTGEMDSQFIQQYYKLTNSIVVRNLPIIRKPTKNVELKKKLDIPDDSKIILYQGVILDGRGIDLTIKAIRDLNDVHFVILGDGVKRKEYEKLASDIGVESRVHFLGTINQSELINYTVEADLGLSLIESISLSYYYALPNKLFEYIAAGVPVLATNLPQMKLVIEEYKVGKAINMDSVETLANELTELLSNENLLKEYSSNAVDASKELNWDREYERVKDKLLIT